MFISVKLLRKQSYPELVRRLAQENQVYAPVTKNNVVLYRSIQSPEEIEEDYILPRLSPKSFVFPRVEQLFSYKKSKGDVEVRNIDTAHFPSRVIWGVRPCDAQGIELLYKVFSDDPKDEIFEARIEKTTVIGMSCDKTDSYCFCPKDTPGSTVGSDILLTRVEDGDFLAEIITEKGKRVSDRYSDLFEDERDNVDKNKYLAEVQNQIDKEKLSNKLPAMFESAVFDEQALRCIGCGTCAYVCPVCSCFDIQDESRGNCGQRLRCWDSCGFGLFTLHTSGHNPRNTQGQRWRQRLMHKFYYIPENSQSTGCVGCGRCSRSCPVDINLVENLNVINGNE